MDKIDAAGDSRGEADAVVRSRHIILIRNCGLKNPKLPHTVEKVSFT
jgi:hypothetical protein